MAGWTEAVQAISAALGVVGIGGALVYSGLQYKRGREVEKAQLDLNLMRLMMDLDVLFVERSHLYRYFNDNAAIPTDGCLRAEVLSTAELILDYADMIARQRRFGQIEDKEMPAWIELLSSYYAGSPAVRDQYQRFKAGYQSGVRVLLGIDAKKESEPALVAGSNAPADAVGVES